MFYKVYGRIKPNALWRAHGPDKEITDPSRKIRPSNDHSLSRRMWGGAPCRAMDLPMFRSAPVAAEEDSLPMPTSRATTLRSQVHLWPLPCSMIRKVRWPTSRPTEGLRKSRGRAPDIDSPFLFLPDAKEERVCLPMTAHSASMKKHT